MDIYETRVFFDLKPTIQFDEKWDKYRKEMDELNKMYKSDIELYKGLPMFQLQLSKYRMEDERRIIDKYFK